MLNTPPYYFNTIKKMVIIFGNIFNDIYINRTNADGSPNALIKVPIEYAPKDKLLARLGGDPELTRQAGIVLPVMSFEFGNLQYDQARHLQSVRQKRLTLEGDPNHAKTQFTPVAYNFPVNLYIYVKNAEDGAKIVEQILPFFSPEFTVAADMVPEMGQIRDIPIELISVSQQDLYDSKWTDRRSLIWTLSFQMRGYFWGPVKLKPFIKFSEINHFVGTTTDHGDNLLKITVTPGLDANGNPTSNSALSVDPLTIYATDDFGFCVDYEDGPFIEEEDE